MLSNIDDLIAFNNNTFSDYLKEIFPSQIKPGLHLQ